MGNRMGTLQENWRYQGNISCKDGHNTGKKWYGLTEAEEIKKRWQEYTEELYKKDLSAPDNHNGLVTHLEPDILEYEVRWVLGSITMNKASRSDGVPAEQLKILKDDAVKVLHSICQQVWKLSIGCRTEKGQFSFQSQRKLMPKDVPRTAQFYLFHLLAR